MGVRVFILIATTSVLAQVVACGGTAEFANGVVGPSLIAGCEQTIDPSSQNVPASGGTFVVEITTGPGCDWAAVSTDSWISMTRGSGSGSGSAAYSVQSNATSSARQGRVRVGDLAVSVTQPAAGTATPTPPSQPPVPPSAPPPSAPPPPAPPPGGCAISVSPASISLADAGGISEITVTADQHCEWQVIGGAEWMSVDPAAGVGSARIRLDVAPNGGVTPRVSTLRIGDATVAVTQGARAEPSCESLRLDPGTQASGVDGGSFTTALSAPADCAWSAVSDSWIAVSPASGAGSGSLSYTVAANDASARAGTIRVGSRSVAVNQAGCAYTLSAGSHEVGAGGGRFTIGVTTGTACTWTASASEPWIEIVSGRGRGSGQVSVAVGAYSGAGRAGHIQIGDRSVDVRQGAAPPCPESVTPPTDFFPASGNDGKFSVTAAADCKWSASADVPWIVISSGSGAGSGTGTYKVPVNDGQERSGRIRIGERSIEVRQAAAAAQRPCPESVSPSTASFSASANESKLSVTAAADCKWSASADRTWIVLSTGSGAGSGTGTYRVLANEGGERSGSIQIGGQSIKVTQSAAAQRPCPESVSPSTASFSASANESKFSVTAAADCKWSASADRTWIVLSTGSGAGSGTGTYRVLANEGGERSGSIQIGGQSIKVTQSAAAQRPCPESVSPSTASFSASANESKFSVTAAADCKWSASADRTWIVLSTGSGAGSGTGTYRVLANEGGERSGSIQIGGQSIKVTQSAAAQRPCPESVSPSTASFSASANESKFSVTAAADCKWSASADASWIVITSGSGAGSGAGTYKVFENKEAARSGGIRIGGQSIRVTQSAAERACTYTLDVSPQTLGAKGDTFTVTITTSPSCSWRVGTDVDWVTPRVASGTGSAKVGVSAQANTSGRSREATFVLNDRTAKVMQPSL